MKILQVKTPPYTLESPVILFHWSLRTRLRLRWPLTLMCIASIRAEDAFRHLFFMTYVAFACTTSTFNITNATNVLPAQALPTAYYLSFRLQSRLCKFLNETWWSNFPRAGDTTEF